jgi:hypothetical protein
VRQLTPGYFFQKKFEFAGSAVLFLSVDQAAIMNPVGKATTITRRIESGYGARIFDHKLTAEDEAFPKLLGRIAAERRRGCAAAQHQQANKIFHDTSLCLRLDWLWFRAVTKPAV